MSRPDHIETIGESETDAPQQVAGVLVVKVAIGKVHRAGLLNMGNSLVDVTVILVNPGLHDLELDASGRVLNALIQQGKRTQGLANEARVLRQVIANPRGKKEHEWKKNSKRSAKPVPDDGGGRLLLGLLLAELLGGDDTLLHLAHNLAGNLDLREREDELNRRKSNH